MPFVLLLLITLIAAPAALGLQFPVLLDPVAAVALIAAPDSFAGQDAERIVLFDRTVIQVEDSGLSHRWAHRLIKVVKPTGALALRALRFDYDPSSNMVEIRGVRVHRADSTFQDIDPQNAIDTEQPGGTILWGTRMKVLAMPPLAPGDGVEILSYTKGFLIAYLGAADFADQVAGGSGDSGGAKAGEAGGGGAAASGDENYIPPMRGHFYDSVLFQDELPMREKSYTVALPRNKPLQYSVYNGEILSSLRFEPQAFVYRFWKEEVPAYQHEERMPDLSDALPKVVMATAEDWEAKSRWFYETNEWVFASSPEIDEKVGEITAGLKSDDEKIAALLHWVAQNIRYFGLSMGKGEGYTLHPGAMTFADRCGVCKDIAGMLVTMLRAAGFETYAAMTMAGARVEDIPADQFNHCVVALRLDDGSFRMLDPTWAPWNRSTWSRWEGEQHYVIGSPWGNGLSRIPSFAPAENLLSVESKAEILPDGTLAGSLRLEGSGVSDSRLRSLPGEYAKRDIRGILENWLGRVSTAAELNEYLFSDHRDFDRDTSLRLSYRIPRFAQLYGNELVFRSPALALLAENAALSRLAATPKGSHREYDLFIWAGQLIKVDETLSVPRGFRVEAPEDLEQSEPQASLNLAWTGNGRRLELRAEIQVDRRTIPAEDFPGLRAVADAVAKQAKASLYAVK